MYIKRICIDKCMHQTYIHACIHKTSDEIIHKQIKSPPAFPLQNQVPGF